MKSHETAMLVAASPMWGGTKKIAIISQSLWWGRCSQELWRMFPVGPNSAGETKQKIRGIMTSQSSLSSTPSHLHAPSQKPPLSLTEKPKSRANENSTRFGTFYLSGKPLSARNVATEGGETKDSEREFPFTAVIYLYWNHLVNWIWKLWRYLMPPFCWAKKQSSQLLMKLIGLNPDWESTFHADRSVGTALWNPYYIMKSSLNGFILWHQ